MGAVSVTAGYALTLAAHVYGDGGTALDQPLAAALEAHGFTGRIEATLEARLGRRIDHQLADLGRLLWFDTVTGLNNDNNCSGCHSPANGFGDSQSIAIGVENNGIVGPNRAGPRNQRRTPMIVNSAFFPNLMWNSRFASLANDPFDSRAGLSFPPPEGLTLSYLRSMAGDSALHHALHDLRHLVGRGPEYSLAQQSQSRDEVRPGHQKLHIDRVVSDRRDSGAITDERVSASRDRQSVCERYQVFDRHDV